MDTGVTCQRTSIILVISVELVAVGCHHPLSLYLCCVWPDLQCNLFHLRGFNKSLLGDAVSSDRPIAIPHPRPHCYPGLHSQVLLTNNFHENNKSVQACCAGVPKHNSTHRADQSCGCREEGEKYK